MAAVSIILPIRNAAVTLDSAIASCLGQTLTDIELLLILNGSTDASDEIARRWAVHDRRVVILDSPPEQGIVGALNLGWQTATSPLIMRMDADDLAMPDRAEAQRALLKERPDVTAVSGHVELLEAHGDGMRRHVDWVNSLQTADQIAAGRFIECPVIHPAAMIRREALVRLGGYRATAWAEDHDLWLRLLGSGDRIGKISDTVISWRDRPERLTRTDPRYASDQVWRMKAHHLARLPSILAQGAAIAGAGPIGKRLGRLLMAEGITLMGFFDVSPRRVGQRIAGLEVADADSIGSRWRQAMLLSAVGVPGGREQVRGVAERAGYAEGRDFWSCC